MECQLNHPATATGPATPLAELSNLQANLLPSSSYFTIFIEVHQSMRPLSIDKVLGKTCVPYLETTTFLGECIYLSQVYSIY